MVCWFFAWLCKKAGLFEMPADTRYSKEVLFLCWVRATPNSFHSPTILPASNISHRWALLQLARGRYRTRCLWARQERQMPAVFLTSLLCVYGIQEVRHGVTEPPRNCYVCLCVARCRAICSPPAPRSCKRKQPPRRGCFYCGAAGGKCSDSGVAVAPQVGYVKPWYPLITSDTTWIGCTGANGGGGVSELLHEAQLAGLLSDDETKWRACYRHN